MEDTITAERPTNSMVACPRDSDRLTTGNDVSTALDCFRLMDAAFNAMGDTLGYLSADAEKLAIPDRHQVYVVPDICPPLLEGAEYACDAWLDHVLAIDAPVLPEPFIDQLAHFLSAHLISWIELCAIRSTFRSPVILNGWIEVRFCLCPTN